MRGVGVRLVGKKFAFEFLHKGAEFLVTALPTIYFDLLEIINCDFTTYFPHRLYFLKPIIFHLIMSVKI